LDKENIKLLRIMKIAIVHDWLVSLSGAERVLFELHNMFPEAPVYTLFHNKKFTSKYLPKAEIRPSFLQRIPGIARTYKYFFFLMPTAIESLDLSNFDLVISSSAVFSKGLVLKPKTRHICYCYSPTRQIWDLHSESQKSNVEGQVLERIAKHFLRLWDRQASDRVDQFVAISNHVADRIKKYYRRDSIVIYPPVILNNEQTTMNKKMLITHCSLPENYYLIVSRLYKHKNIDIAIEAFEKLNLPLVVIGTGPEYKNLRSKIKDRKSKINFLGFIPDEELPYYYQNCRAFIMPQEEDFGITSVEAMSYGKPVLALKKGGATETVVEGVTGEFFDDPIPEALADGMRRLNENYSKYNIDKIKSQSQKFSVERFREEIKRLVYNKYNEALNNHNQL